MKIQVTEGKDSITDQWDYTSTVIPRKGETIFRQENKVFYKVLCISHNIDIEGAQSSVGVFVSKLVKAIEK